MSAVAASSSGPLCGICLAGGETPKTVMVIFFPSHISGMAHEKCFQKIKTVWQPFFDGLKKAFGDEANLKHGEAITFIYKTELTPAKKTMLQVIEDQSSGEAELSKIMQLVLKTFVSLSHNALHLENNMKGKM